MIYLKSKDNRIQIKFECVCNTCYRKIGTIYYWGGGLKKNFEEFG